MVRRRTMDGVSVAERILSNSPIVWECVLPENNLCVADQYTGMNGDSPSRQTESAKPGRGRLLYWLVAFPIAGILLFFSLRGIEWVRIREVLAGANFLLIALAAMIASGNMLMRSLRWRVLLLAETRVAPSTTFWATAMGYFGNNILPARAGEFIRMYLVSSSAKVSKTFVMTTVLLERAADAIALVACTALVLLTLKSVPEWLTKASRPFAIVCGGAALLITFLPGLQRLGLNMIRKLPLPEAIRQKAAGAVDQVLTGVRAIHHVRRLLLFLSLTVMIWATDAAVTVIGSYALGLPMSFATALLLIASLGLSSAIPSTPGYVGIYQFVAVNVLPPFGFSRTDAIAFILYAQAMSYLQYSFWGVLAMLKCKNIAPRAGSPVATQSATRAAAMGSGQ